MDGMWNGGGGCSLPALAFAAILRGLRTQRKQPLRRQKAQYGIGLGSLTRAEIEAGQRTWFALKCLQCKDALRKFV